MVKYTCSKTISNSYLGVRKDIKAANEFELKIKVKDQLNKWHRQEQIKRQQDHRFSLQEKAIHETRQAEERIKSYRNLLVDSLNKDNKLQWSTLFQGQSYKPFHISPQYPTYEEIAAEIGVPEKRPIVEFFLNFIEKNRLEKEQEAQRLLEAKIQAIVDEETQARKKYDEEKLRYETAREKHNQSVRKFRSDFESGNPEAICKYIKLILQNSEYPEAITKDFDAKFDQTSSTLILDYFLPNPEELPKNIQFKYVSTNKTITSVEMKKKEFEEFYDSLIFQFTLRNIHEVFSSDHSKNIHAVVFNGWVRGVDPKTGNDFTSCILTCHALRCTFETFNLARLDPKQCVRNLKGLFAGNLTNLAPVKPIMQLNTNDSRFVPSKEILSTLDPSKNLAAMEWEDFEHLVRELFEIIYRKDGADVKVTQASRDGGIDAVVFDPNPIKGGKTIIQAKRYNIVVPVSAVRELYGTVVDKGACKGILVTTSHFGPDSYEFVNEKPITLIDGANLLHLFKEHGHDLYIQTK